MRSIHRVLLSMFVAGSMLVALGRPSEACSAPDCWSGAFIPDDTGAQVPANLPAVVWRPMQSGSEPLPVDPAAVELVDAAGEGDPVPLTAVDLEAAEVELTLGAPLAAGTTYRLADRSTCGPGGEPGPVVTFEATAPAALPESLGTLELTPLGRGSLQVATGIGSCSSALDADRVQLDLVPSASSAPWIAALRFETLVDDQPWSAHRSASEVGALGASWTGRGRDLVYLGCASDDATVVSSGVAAGTHTARMRATLPGTTIVLETEPVELTLVCDGPGTEPPDDEPGADPDGDDGGCAAGGTSSPAGAIALALALVLVGRRRRFPSARS